MNWSEFWSQGWWQGVSGILSVLGIFVAVYFYIKQNKKRKLGFRLIYSESMLAINKEVESDLKVTYKDRQVEQINILEIQVINNGGIPIRKSDFETVLTLEVVNSKTLFDLELVDCYPDNLIITIEHKENKIFIFPLLLNPGEFFKVKVIFDGPDREFNLFGRIEGITDFEDITFPSAIREILPYALLGLFLAYAIFKYLVNFKAEELSKDLSAIIIFLFIVWRASLTFKETIEDIKGRKKFTRQ